MKNKKTFKAFLSLIFPVFSFIALKIVDNLLGNGIPLLEYCVVSSTIIVSMVTTFFILTVVVIKVDDILDHRYNETDCPVTEKCKYNEDICCAKLALETIQGDYDLILDQTIARQYNLFSEDEIIEKESSFNQGEIWVFSYDLTTEVLGDSASQTVANNLKKGIVYREFYIDTRLNEAYGNVAINRRRMEKWYEHVRRCNGKECLLFYPYTNPDSLLNYMFALFGIVLYITDTDNPDSIDAFFSLRSTNSRVKKPIYVKMPHCMTNNYYGILINIINNTSEE